MPVKPNTVTDTRNEHQEAKTPEETTEQVPGGTASDSTGGGTGSPRTPADDAEIGHDSDTGGPVKGKRQINWSRVLVFGMLPAVALLLAMAAAFFKWQDASMRLSDRARIESVQAAKDATVALLSYRPDTVEQDLMGVRDRLTGDFRGEYTKLIQDVVIPGAKQQHISATASVAAAASVSATPGHAVVLVFVNQTTTVGTTAPTDLQSSVRVTMDRIDDRWLISKFSPV
ncbi:MULTISPECIES: hypothetical protein [unclassified Mycobacterium]|uniref:hypothetical protein n=1 Tax=unclassified Mycobacterium TaxID=2642494 RepID=UPI000740062A|nr:MULTISPECIES: hypothetical protein [unclassified Mycobacterium]KUH83139.1 hypothetical protein AU185_05010 [Mycobacterium sp. GA-0227b]KUH84450.1 hypothetical protein AU186_21550 [Mycobacterium sp. GA-1999]KUH89413.1 hypothetical protein AU187_09875 [Mycobacterium sp. IS-1556]